MAVWTRVTGGVAAVAIGEAGAAAVAPAIEVPKQDAWLKEPNLILGPDVLAHLVATGLLKLDSKTVEESKRSGLDEHRLKALIQLNLHAPGVAEALTLFRRNDFVSPNERVSEAMLEHSFAKAGIEKQYHHALKAMVQLPLEGGALATGIHRGYIEYKAPGFVAPPDTPGKVPFYPQTNVDAIATARALGMDKEQLAVMVGNAGLPLSLFEMLQLLNRSLVTEDDVKRAIANSNLQNQYMDVALELRRLLLTPHDYAENYLRGNITYKDMVDGAALRGMTEGDIVQLYKLLGRSIPVHQVLTGSARGGVFDGPTHHIPPEYLQSLERGNLRPEYYNLAYANRYTYPSYFVIRPLIQAGLLSAEEGEKIFLYEGWEPDLAKKVAAFYSTNKGGTAKSPTTTNLLDLYLVGEKTRDETHAALVSAGYTAEGASTVLDAYDAKEALSARTKFLTALHKAYIGGALLESQGRDYLAKAGVTGDAQDRTIYYYNLEVEMEKTKPPAPAEDLTALVNEARAAGYTVIPPPPPPPDYVTKLQLNGYTVTKA